MRRKDREIKDINEALNIIDRAKILRLSLMDGDYPYIVPLHYGYEYSEGKLNFYMHCAKEGHKLDLIKNNSHASIELDCDVELVSGGEDACKYGSLYASVIARGIACIVEDSVEKIHALGLLMKNQTGRYFEIDEKMALAVAVIKFDVKEFTAKARKMPIK